FGRSLVVWISLLALIVFVSLVWMSQSVLKTAYAGFGAVEQYYADDQLHVLRHVKGRSMVVVLCLFGVSLGVLLNNYSLLSKRALENETLLGVFQNIAYTDPLTGVKSKQAYKEKEKEMDAAIGRGTAPDFGLLVCDANGLKHVNDTQGHKAGDEYIIAATRMICGLFVHSPVYRTGGDEFVVYLQGYDFESRSKLAQKLREKSIENISSEEVVGLCGAFRIQKGLGPQHTLCFRTGRFAYVSGQEGA
ncbi:MAG: GGDEF domain-containing protein, partial [Abditibacteriota bacterium]|nr:GGDEF domain-containing protein [Abditibacteriota bacterium]